MSRETHILKVGLKSKRVRFCGVEERNEAKTHNVDLVQMHCHTTKQLYTLVHTTGNGFSRRTPSRCQFPSVSILLSQACYC